MPCRVIMKLLMDCTCFVRRLEYLNELLLTQFDPHSLIGVFKKYTKLAMLAFLPTLCSHIFAVFCFVGTL